MTAVPFVRDEDEIRFTKVYRDCSSSGLRLFHCRRSIVTFRKRFWWRGVVRPSSSCPKSAMNQNLPKKTAAPTTPMPVGMSELLAREHAHSQSPRRRMMLFVFHRDGVRTTPLAPATPIVVGRGAAADLQVPDNSLSRQHARFCLEDDHVIVEDLKSTNGTFVRGEAVERTKLDAGEEVSLGGVIALVHELSRGRAHPTFALLSGVDTYDAFVDALGAELVRARYFSRAVAVVTVRYLQRTGDASLRHVCARFREELLPVDRIALYSADSMEILLPEVDGQAALVITNKLLSHHPDEPLLVAGIAAFPTSADTVDKLVETSRNAVREASAQRRVHVAAELGTRAWVPADTPNDDNDPRDIIARSKEMRSLIDTAKRIAKSSIPVLLLGETGTGKEVLARKIHESSPRKDKPMVCVNCAAIPQQLVESTLFGHEKGAFTGAVSQHKGVFEAADGGTVFLDEIGELPAAAQAALLRVLEIRKVCRVGSTREIPIEVRVIAATHRDLENMAETGGFRADLLYRLNTMTLRIPPLRSRREEIPALVARFLEQACRINGASIRAVDPTAMNLLSSYVWPGNVRELRNAIERAVVIAEGDIIRVIDLPERVRAAAEPPIIPAASASLTPGSAPSPTVIEPPVEILEVDEDDEEELDSEDGPLDGTFRAAMRRYEAKLLLAALRAADGNQTEAAKRLQLPRRTFQHKIKLHGIRRLGYGVSAPIKRS